MWCRVSDSLCFKIKSFETMCDKRVLISLVTEHYMSYKIFVAECCEKFYKMTSNKFYLPSINLKTLYRPNPVECWPFKASNIFNIFRPGNCAFKLPWLSLTANIFRSRNLLDEVWGSWELGIMARRMGGSVICVWLIIIYQSYHNRPSPAIQFLLIIKHKPRQFT